MPKIPICKHCGDTGHYAITCFSKPRKVPERKSYFRSVSKKPIPSESDKTKKKRLSTRRRFFRQYPDGKFECYLQISIKCTKAMNTRTVLLEHVMPRVRYPQYKYEVKNIKPSCSWCNGLKGSLEIKDLVKSYPHLQKYLPRGS